jgi:hypothetical protein
LFDQVPAWLIKLSLWDVLSASAYTLSYSLVESLLLWGFFLIVARILPPRLFRRRLVAHTALVVWISAAWAVAAQAHYPLVAAWSFADLAPWLFAVLLSILAGEFLLWKVKNLAGWIERLAGRIAILASLYILTGIAGLVIVIVRNI